MPRAPLSVIIPTRDRPEMLTACIESVRASLGPTDELLVVDSCSAGPGTAQAAAAAGVRCVRAPVKGASVARNLGWRVATHDGLAFVDDDVRVDTGWADAIAAALALPGVGFVTGRVGTPPGQEDVARKVALVEHTDPIRIDRDVVGMIGHSANLGMRRDAVALVGGFDERLGPGHPFIAEDYDLFDRLLAAGVVGRYEPAALAWHEQWRDRSERLKLDWNYGLGTGARLSKLARLDRRRFVKVGRHVVSEWVLDGLKADVKAGSKLGVVHAGVLAGGIVSGFVAASRIPLEGGHLHAERAEG